MKFLNVSSVRTLNLFHGASRVLHKDFPTLLPHTAMDQVRPEYGIFFPPSTRAFHIPDAAKMMLTIRERAMMNVDSLCVAIRFAFVVFTTIILIPTATFVSSASNVTYKNSLE
jgi:hypothetical protein